MLYKATMSRCLLVIVLTLAIPARPYKSARENRPPVDRDEAQGHRGGAIRPGFLCLVTPETWR